MGFAQEPLGQWFSSFSVLRKDPKNFLEMWSLGLSLRYLDIFSESGVGPRSMHFNRFPMDSDADGLQTSL